jgi:hypothetical protein
MNAIQANDIRPGGTIMSIKSRLFTGTLAATVLGAAPLVCVAEAQVVSHSKDIVVVLPSSLPELVQRHGIAFQLYSESGDGNSTCTSSSPRAKRLLVLNVASRVTPSWDTLILACEPSNWRFPATPKEPRDACNLAGAEQVAA